MPVEAKPLFRPDVLRRHLAHFALPAAVETQRPMLARWAGLLTSDRADKLKEQELLPDFLSDFFVGLLCYSGPAGAGPHTLSREKHVQVDGKFADAVLGHFGDDQPRYVVALEGKGPRDPLDRPFAGRRMSAVDQGYRYAINLPCDWIIVTSIRQTRLYHKGSDQHTYERFDTDALADDEALLRRFVFLLAADRVTPATGRCHLHALLGESEKVRGKKNPLSAAALKALREEHARSIEPARAMAAQSLRLEAQVSDLVNAAYGLTPDEIALMWKTAPPRMPNVPR